MTRKHNKVTHEKTEYKKSPQLKKHALLAHLFPSAITGRRKMEKTK